jgi:hypothetical protein
VRIELKAKGGRLSESQAAVKRHLEGAGQGYLWSSDYREVVETVRPGACCDPASACSEGTFQPDRHTSQWTTSQVPEAMSLREKTMNRAVGFSFQARTRMKSVAARAANCCGLTVRVSGQGRNRLRRPPSE